MANPVYESADDQTATATSTTDVAVNKPTNLANGDVVLLVFAASATAQQSTPVVSFPAGFTEIFEVLSTPESYMNLNVAWKEITNAAGEPSTYTVSNDESPDSLTLSAIRISGAESSDPIDVYGTDAGGASTACPDITTTVDECLLLAITSTSGGAVNTFTPPAGYTEQVDFGVDGGRAVDQSVATDDQVSAGATGTATFSISGGHTHWNTAHIAIQPPQGPATRFIGYHLASQQLASNKTPNKPLLLSDRKA